MNRWRLISPRTDLRLKLAALLSVVLFAAAPTSSLAAGDHAGHGGTPAEPAEPAPASADEQRQGAHPQPVPETDQHGAGHDAATGDLSADGDAAADQHKADGVAGQQHGGHGEAGDVAADRPVKLVLGGFAALNGLVIVAAAILRRRPASVKRRETLARVQSGAGARRGKKDRS